MRHRRPRPASAGRSRRVRGPAAGGGEDAAGQVKRLLTLQVGGDQPAIVQAQGHHNRRPTTAELVLLTRWAIEGGPYLAPAVRLGLDLRDDQLR